MLTDIMSDTTILRILMTFAPATFLVVKGDVLIDMTKAATRIESKLAQLANADHPDPDRDDISVEDAQAARALATFFKTNRNRRDQ